MKSKKSKIGKKKNYIKKTKKTVAPIIREEAEYLFPELFSNKNKIKQTTLTKKKDTIIDLGQRGLYHKNNKLNDLTGREWKFATSSS